MKAKTASLAGRQVAAFGFDAVEAMLMARPLAEVLRRLADGDRATVPPPRAQ